MPTPNLDCLDPDFLFFALPLSCFLVTFVFASIFFSFGIAGFSVSLIFGIPLTVWSVKKEETAKAAKEAEKLAKSQAEAQVKQKVGMRAKTWLTTGMGKKVMKRAYRMMGKKVFAKMLT